MATVILGCDRNNGNDSNCQNEVAKVLESAGNTVEKLEIGPNQFASYSYSGKAKGKIGVFLIASGITAIADLYDGNTNFKYAYFGIRGDLKQPRLSTMEEFKKSPISKDWHGDCISKSCNSLAGKTYPQMNEVTKSKCIAVFGETCKELGENIVKEMGGKSSSDDDDDGGSSASTIKDALKKAVSGWDGDVEVKIRDDTVYVNKIPDPTKTTLIINEFENVLTDSITVTDINPQTPNKITLPYDGYELTLKDDVLIKRFGEVPLEVEVDDTVKNYEDAVAFLQRSWNKIRRDDGRSIELKVDGDLKWKTGLWVRVFLPSCYIDDYMYITRMSADEDGSNNWTTSLTLVDYPPSFGTYAEEEPEEEEEDEDSETDDIDAETTEETTT